MNFLLHTQHVITSTVPSGFCSSHPTESVHCFISILKTNTSASANTHIPLTSAGWHHTLLSVQWQVDKSPEEICHEYQTSRWNCETTCWKRWCVCQPKPCTCMIKKTLKMFRPSVNWIQSIIMCFTSENKLFCSIRYSYFMFIRGSVAWRYFRCLESSTTSLKSNTILITRK